MTLLLPVHLRAPEYPACCSLPAQCHCCPSLPCGAGGMCQDVACQGNIPLISSDKDPLTPACFVGRALAPAFCKAQGECHGLMC